MKSKGEVFKIKVKINENGGKFYLPLHNKKIKRVDWFINWGDGKNEHHAFNIAEETAQIEHTFDSAGEYWVTISPGNYTVNGWLTCWGFNAWSSLEAFQLENRALIIDIDAVITPRMVGLGTDKNYINWNYSNMCSSWFAECHNNTGRMHLSDEFNKFQKIPDHFFENCFFENLSLKNGNCDFSPIFENASVVGQNFLYGTFQGCEALEKIPNFQKLAERELQIIEHGFFRFTFSDCVSLKNLGGEVSRSTSLNWQLDQIPDEFFFMTFANCQSLQNTAGFLQGELYTQKFIMRVGHDCYSMCFYGCSQLESVENSIFFNFGQFNSIITQEYYRGLAPAQELSLENFPGVAWNFGAGFASRTFEGCYSLKEINLRIFLSLSASAYKVNNLVGYGKEYTRDEGFDLLRGNQQTSLVDNFHTFMSGTFKDCYNLKSLAVTPTYGHLDDELNSVLELYPVGGARANQDAEPDNAGVRELANIQFCDVSYNSTFENCFSLENIQIQKPYTPANQKASLPIISLIPQGVTRQAFYNSDPTFYKTFKNCKKLAFKFNPGFCLAKRKEDDGDFDNPHDYEFFLWKDLYLEGSAFYETFYNCYNFVGFIDDTSPELQPGSEYIVSYYDMYNGTCHNFVGSVVSGDIPGNSQLYFNKTFYVDNVNGSYTSDLYVEASNPNNYLHQGLAQAAPLEDAQGNQVSRQTYTNQINMAQYNDVNEFLK